MKKLLLLLSLLLLFWISSADTFTFVYSTGNATSSASNLQTTSTNQWFSFYLPVSQTLVSFLTPNAHLYQCKDYTWNIYSIYRNDTRNTRTFINSWMFTWFNWTTTTDVWVFLTWWYSYYVDFTVLATKNCAYLPNTYSSFYQSWFISIWWYSQKDIFWLNTITFSWSLPTVATIYYNNGASSTGTASSSIYLNWIAPTVTTSGSSLVFTFVQNIFRALFRSN